MIVFVSAEVKPEHKKEGVTLVTPHNFDHIDWSKVEDVTGDDYYVEKAVSLGASRKDKVKKDEHGTPFDPELHEPELYKIGDNKGQWKPKK